MGLRIRIFLGMLVVVLVALASTAIVAYDYSQQQEVAYNNQRLLRKEAALGRSLDYVIERHGGSLSEDSISTIFTDHICELADVHGLMLSLYRNDGLLLTTSAAFSDEDQLPDLALETGVLSVLKLKGDRVISQETLGPNEITQVHWLVASDDGVPLFIASARYNPRPLTQGGIRPFLNRLAPVYLFLFLGAMLIAYLIVRSIVKPLFRLKVEMAKVDPLGNATTLDHRWNDEVGELVDQYNELLSKLRESLIRRAKDEREGAWREMAQQVAHEIKNPLTPLRLGIQQLERAWNDGVDDFPTRLERFTSTALSQIDVLAAIAEDFALLAVVREAEIVSVDLSDVVNKAAGLYGEENVTVEEKKKGLYVEGDSSRLIRAFNNLIANALDSIYEADSKTPIRVEISEEGRHAVVKVIDQGTGIPTQKLDRIFEPRFTTKTHGLGLGLAMVKSIVEQSNGDVSVESKEGKGATFIIKLLQAGR
ncbi:MAG TPA: HAMP domain-containing histidine kinase [Flavobacteriales bacterium]|nr:HAMP domain-containing histidine kinase [Flavobacteriales bacterium]